MPGRVIAVCAAAGFVALLIYGLSFDVRGWFEERSRRRDERRREEREREQALLELRRRAMELRRVTDEVSWVAQAMAEIRDLPTAAGR